MERLGELIPNDDNLNELGKLLQQWEEDNQSYITKRANQNLKKKEYDRIRGKRNYNKK